MPIRNVTATVTPSFPEWIQLTLSEYIRAAQGLAEDRDTRPHVVNSNVFLLFATPLELQVLSHLQRHRTTTLQSLKCHFQERLRVHAIAVLGLGLHDKSTFMEIKDCFADIRLRGSLELSSLPRHAPVAEIGINMRWLSEDEGWPSHDPLNPGNDSEQY